MLAAEQQSGGLKMNRVSGKKGLWKPMLVFAGLVAGTMTFLWSLAEPAKAREEPAEKAQQIVICQKRPVPRAPQEPSSGEKLRQIELSGDYPEELIAFARNNREAVDFVYGYPEKKDLHPPVDLRAEAAGEEAPLLLQWDERWGYLPYGEGLLGTSGCGPLCLSMAALWLTKDPQWTPVRVAQLAEEQGYRVPGSGSSWTLMTEGAALTGLRSEELILSEEAMNQALDRGCLLILVVGPGDFTRGGHFLLVRGREKGGFLLNDPNSRENSRKVWTYERLRPQILNLWALEKQD